MTSASASQPSDAATPPAAAEPAADPAIANANPSATQTAQTSDYQLCSPGLPLAVYREVAAHLQQITGVEVELLRQQSIEFDYTQSQVAGIRIRHQEYPECYARVEQVLGYYGDRYAPWETLRP